LLTLGLSKDTTVSLDTFIHAHTSRYTGPVLTQVLSGGVRREGISAARENDVTRDGRDFVGAGRRGFRRRGGCGAGRGTLGDVLDVL